MMCKMVGILIGGALVILAWLYGLNQDLGIEPLFALFLFTIYWAFMTWQLLKEKENEPLE